MMNATETSDFAHVKLDPASWYALPQAILDDPQLRRAEKQDLLAEWALDLSDRSMAADEGMLQPAAGLIDKDVQMQALVVAAQAMLAETAAEGAALSLPERIWRRITGQATETTPDGSKVME